MLLSFLRNCIDPKSKNETENWKSIHTIYNTVAANTEMLQDIEADCELLRQNHERATETFMENKIFIKELHDMNLDFSRMLKEEALKVFKRYA